MRCKFIVAILVSILFIIVSVGAASLYGQGKAEGYGFSFRGVVMDKIYGRPLSGVLVIP